MSMLNRNAVRSAGVFLVFLVFGVSILIAQEAPPSLTIDEAVRMALSKNPTVQAAREEVAAAKARVRGARANRIPEVVASVEYTRVTPLPTFEIPSTGPGIPASEVTISRQETTVGTIAARQAVYTGGRIPAQVSGAEATLDAVVARLGATEARVALQTREAYYGVLLSQSLVQSAEKSLAAGQEQLGVATAKFEVGTAARFDVLRAQTQISEAEQNLMEVRNQVEISRVALSKLLGAPLEQVFTLPEPATAPLPEEDLSSLVETATGQRAELLAAHAQLAAAEAGIRLAESARRPELGLTANYQVVAEESPVQVTGWTFMATASMEIFDGGRTRANITESRSLRDEARANLEETSRTVEQDVRQTYLSLHTVRQTIETAGTRLAQAEEAYEVATVRYEAGVGTAVELADALATLTAARTNLDQSIFRYNIAYARLQRALGRITY